MGVIISSSLTWHDHIKILCNKVSKSIGILLRVKKNVDVNVLKMFFYSLIQPYFQYCNIIMATRHTQHIELLFRKQEKAVRIISLSKWNAHTKPLFINHRILTLSNINIFQVCCFMYKVRYNLLPSFCINCSFLNNAIHHHCTRNATKFYIISQRHKHYLINKD